MRGEGQALALRYQLVGALCKRATGSCGQAGVLACVFGCLKQDIQDFQDFQDEVSCRRKPLFRWTRSPERDDYRARFE